MKYIIHGRTQSGHVFRPSDWSDRLCSVLAHYKTNVPTRQGHHTATYSKYLMPSMVNGIRSVLLDDSIGLIEPLALNFVLNFASDNNLVIEPCSD